MPKYRAKLLCFVDGAKIRPGQVFTTDAPPNEAWEPLDGPAPEATRPVGAPAPKPSPVEDPFEKMDDQKLRDFIQTKGGPNPAPNASTATLRARARAAAGAQE